MIDCDVCYGYGWYPIGRLTPIGQMDAGGWGSLVVKCPWCGAGYVEDEKYDDLLIEKNKDLINAKEEKKK